MILGAVIVTVAVWFFNRNDNPFSQTSATKQASPTPDAAAQAANGSSANGAAGSQQAPAALPGKPGDRPVERPDYTFFNTLPNEGNAPAAPTAPAGSPQSQPRPQIVAPPPVQAALDKQVYLQLASFESAEQADDLKARLLLMGLDPITQRAQLADGRVVHRIRVGPFTNREDLKAMRSRLVSNGFNAEEISN
jgi:cell division protein FtsN